MNTINCPNCGTAINVNHVLAHQIEETLKVKLRAKENSLKEEFQKKQQSLLEKQKEVEYLMENQTTILQARLNEEKKKIEKDAEEKIKLKLIEDHESILKMKDEELELKSKQVRDYNKMKADYARIEREKNELAERLEAENQEKLNVLLEEQRVKIKNLLESQHELRIKELEKKLEDQRKLTEQMKRKQEQGSMQLQGEVMEVAIEEFLSVNFPLDVIEEVKKGAIGADCLQIVNTFDIQNCGTIYYESKRAKNFSAGWIEKFKSDIREKQADIGVLVTEVLPAGMDRMGYYQGIYVCRFDEFKGLANILRQTLISINTAIQSQENKGDKMVMLYNFLSSTEFRLQMEGIIEGFQQMKCDLQREKTAMSRIWKQREKQLEKVSYNTINMYGAIRGIAGNAIQAIQSLELDSADRLIENN